MLSVAGGVLQAGVDVAKHLRLMCGALAESTAEVALALEHCAASGPPDCGSEAERTFSQVLGRGAGHLAVSLPQTETLASAEAMVLSVREMWERAPRRPDETEIWIEEPAVFEALIAGREWEVGCRSLSTEAYWDAHEAWETIWRALGDGIARESMQGLIQTAAACHKVTQAVDGRDEVGMRRGMAALIGSARKHLVDDATDRAGVVVGFSRETVTDALDDLARLCTAWSAGTPLGDVAQSVADVASRLAERLLAEAKGRPIVVSRTAAEF